MATGPVPPLPDVEFAIVRRGYDQDAVNGHLRRLDAQISILATDRNAAVEQATQLARELERSRARAERLREQAGILAKTPQDVQGMSERMRSMLRMAEDEALEMMARAERDVDRRLHEAEQEAARILVAARTEAEREFDRVRAESERSAADAARARAELEAERIAMHEQVAHERAVAERRIAEERAEAEQWIAAAGDEAGRQRAEAWAESEARRALVEEDFQLASDRRRTEVRAAITAERLDARRDTEALREATAKKARLIEAEATSTAAKIVTDAERRVAELTAVRGRVIEQLRSSRAVLDRTLGALAPTSDTTAPDSPAPDGDGDGDIVTQRNGMDPRPARGSSQRDRPTPTSTPRHDPAEATRR